MADICIICTAQATMSTTGGIAAASGLAAQNSGVIGNVTTAELYFDDTMPESQFFLILERIKVKAKKYYNGLSFD